MLINFSVENFRSFNEEQTLNLIANKSQKGHEDHFVPIANTGQHALPLAIIYGANAAGKSNLVQAMAFAQAMVINGPGMLKQLALNQFRFSSKGTKPSSFEFRFMVSGQVFIYGFDVTPEEVISEWLVSVDSKGKKESDIFSRDRQEIKFGKINKIAQDGDASLEVLKALELLGARPDQLLLNIIVNLDKERRGAFLGKIVWWFKECLIILGPHSQFLTLLEYLDKDDHFREFSSKFLSNVGTGINGLHIDHLKINADELPKEFLDLLETVTSMDIPKAGSGVDVFRDPDDPTKVMRKNLTAKHSVSEKIYSLPFDEESDGTQRLLNLLPVMYHLRHNSRVYVIDEIDRSLHPLLSYAMLKFFVEHCSGADHQLIVTTHESYLLDRKLLRRDEVWFAEKDSQQQTHLHSLADMKIRKDTRIEKGYLQGRFGGIPFIGGMDRLNELIDCGSDQ